MEEKPNKNEEIDDKRKDKGDMREKQVRGFSIIAAIVNVQMSH